MKNRTVQLKLKIEKHEAMNFLLMLYIICFADGLVCRNLFLTVFQWSLVFLSAILLFREKGFGKDYIGFVFVAAAMLVGMVYLNNITGAWFFKISLFSFAIYMSSHISLEYFSIYFRKTMKFIVIVNLIFFALYLLGIQMSFLPTLVNRRGSNFLTIFLGNLPINRGSGILTKLRGPFWEPGPYASYLCFSIALELLISKKKDITYIVLLIISLVLTFSTTGYLAVSLILGAVVFSKNEGTNQKWIRVGVIILIITTVGLMIYSETINNTLFGKIYSENESYKGRTNCFIANLYVIRDNPIFGVGVTKGGLLIEEYMRSLGSRWSVTNVNTILSNFAYFGLVCGLYYLIKLIQFCFHVGTTAASKILLLLSCTFILSCFGFQYSLFFTVIFFLRKNGQEIQSDA